MVHWLLPVTLWGGSMAIFHCSVKTVSRSAGRSATAAAAYRAGECIKDERTGTVHDYTRKQGILYAGLVLPHGVSMTRAELWNSAELSEKRKNSTVAREYEIALPGELTSEQQQSLAMDFARDLVERYGVAADVCIHAPGKGGDARNVHAHILTTTRTVSTDGFGAKTRVLDDRKSGEIEYIRSHLAELTNAALESAGYTDRVDHRSLREQGIQRAATVHMGPAATQMERRGERTRKGDHNRGIAELNRDIEVLEFQHQRVEGTVLLSHLKKAIRDVKEKEEMAASVRDDAIHAKQALAACINEINAHNRRVEEQRKNLFGELKLTIKDAFTGEVSREADRLNEKYQECRKIYLQAEAELKARMTDLSMADAVQKALGAACVHSQSVSRVREDLAAAKLRQTETDRRRQEEQSDSRLVHRKADLVELEEKARQDIQSRQSKEGSVRRPEAQDVSHLVGAEQSHQEATSCQDVQSCSWPVLGRADLLELERKARAARAAAEQSSQEALEKERRRVSRMLEQELRETPGTVGQHIAERDALLEEWDRAPDKAAWEEDTLEELRGLSRDHSMGR